MAARPLDPRRRLPRAAAALSLLLSALGGAMAQAPEDSCGPLGNAFGPFDYRSERGNNLRIVESAHFPPHVEFLIRGHSTNLLGGDLDYTLRAFPNHHRALMSTMRLGLREKAPQLPGMRYPVECYFVRAVRFRPDDTTARMLYAMYLHRHGRLESARQELGQVAAQAGDNGFTHYNLGLLYLEIGDAERALQQAHKALALGFPRTELRDRLSAAGQWRDAPAAPGGPQAPAGEDEGKDEDGLPGRLQADTR